jgi:antitoxin component of RelBE/YafQ-DinJ toxin-antitoxin module
MVRDKRKPDPLPDHFNSAEEAGEFWDTHSGADYEEYMIPVRFDVDLKRSAREVRIADEVIREVSKIARRQGLKTETLINLWLQQRLLENGKPSRRTAKQTPRKQSAKKPARSRNGVARAAKA